MRSGWLRGSIYWVLLFCDRFFDSKPLSQIQRCTLLLLQEASHTPPSVDWGLSINNDSSAVARRLRFVGSIMKSPGIEIRDGLPSAPSRRLYVVPRIVTNPEVPIRLKEYGDRWEVIIDFGDIRPHERAYTTEVIHVGSEESKVARLEGEILGDNIPVPIACTLEIHFETEQKAMTAADAMKYMSSE